MRVVAVPLEDAATFEPGGQAERNTPDRPDEPRREREQAARDTPHHHPDHSQDTHPPRGAACRKPTVEIVEHPRVPTLIQPSVEQPVSQVRAKRRARTSPFAPTSDHHVDQRCGPVCVRFSGQFGFLERRLDLGAALRSETSRKGAQRPAEPPRRVHVAAANRFRAAVSN